MPCFRVCLTHPAHRVSSLYSTPIKRTSEVAFNKIWHRTSPPSLTSSITPTRAPTHTKRYTPKIMRYVLAGVAAGDSSHTVRRHVACNACQSLALLPQEGQGGQQE